MFQELTPELTTAIGEFQYAPWLVANLMTAIVSASVIASFGATIEKMVVLAALSPIVASIGGNTGNQTMAVIVRALATGQMTDANTRRTFGE